ncbi:ATP-binding cassette domain-containing protein [Paenibacillus wynnii]|uniref:ATP-binding cassette domain-containing protein n=1 Tax=Paenibacillus wynnii TaxID=268407 RepID=UPI0027942418|nr:ATP-binding cassette domain-containing protein [Paenibacillus wynnii]MDQ0192341.1 energy-coupling factor transport system ATP-binding protein [Paenibacillus wynnii]
MIQAHNLSLIFQDGQLSLPVLQGIHLHIERGEWLALTGANGCGKSSLIRTFNGLLMPSAGSLTAAGLDLRSPINRKTVKERIQLVFQNPESQTIGSTPAEDIAFGLENRGIPQTEMQDRIEVLLGKVGLAQKAGDDVSTLSGGERQRLAVASCLALDAEMIIFDEVTSMLDPIGRQEIFSLARDLWKQGTTVVWVTQRMEELSESPRIAVMEEGKIIYDGDPRSLFYASPLPDKLGWDLPPVLGIGRLLQSQGWAKENLPLTESDLEGIL